MAIVVGELALTGAALTVGYVGWHSSTREPVNAPAAGSSITGEPRIVVAKKASTLPASQLRAGMVVDFHGRRWAVVRVNRVSTRPGILLELREAGTPGFHILYVDPESSITVVGRV